MGLVSHTFKNLILEPETVRKLRTQLMGLNGEGELALSIGISAF
ncbi:Uncharacterized protein {ECO:0000313/EMBL:CCF08967.1} [Pantoea ananatis]|jgi:hypothetical protein|nr:hypothetical protein PANA5342_1574 [Pantoea ananatis LMG 5342]CRH29991.1 Uncharacterized protein {ECO:0000313/EMBL:CCF08967.1} [Pantoea ananatis]CRH34470.1 Uncharacterized protein BN1183_BI_00190 [Pantoea ananatis]CRH39001.1 Uncharacterized protein {ECO:0000313/EMBL:CCF08967.1} [Pantoea ananatis]